MSLNNEEKANIKCNSCKTYRYPSDFLNDKNRTLKTCKNCRSNAKKMRDKKSTKEATKDADDILQVLKDNTPLCEDVIGLIIEYTIPSKFEIGSVYYQKEQDWHKPYYCGDGKEFTHHYKIVKRTKCFIYISNISDINSHQNIKFQICLDDESNEYIELFYASIINATYKIA